MNPNRTSTTTRVPATYMRGGTSKGVFFVDTDLPQDPTLRDRLLMRIMGSPDPYGKQIDGMGAATSSTSKVVILSRTSRSDSDIAYRFGQVAIDSPHIDWSGNCGNLTTAVAPLAISLGLVKAPAEGIATVRMWQANLGKRIIAHVTMQAGEVVEAGDFELDGVTFAAAEIRLEFLEPGGGGEADQGDVAMLPSGRVLDLLDIPGLGTVELTLLNAGNPTVFIAAQALGLTGTELQSDINSRPELLARLEAVRAHGAVAMGIASSVEDASRHHRVVPRLCFVAPAQDYQASNGRPVSASSIAFNARIISVGQLHHAMTGTGAIALSVAAALPGSVVNRVLKPDTETTHLVFGHPSGTLAVGAHLSQRDGQWTVERSVMSRSARRLMQGWVFACV